MKRYWPLFLMFVFWLTACSLGGDNNPVSFNQEVVSSDDKSKTYGDLNIDLSSGPANLNKLDMSLAKLGPFYSMFLLSFDGSQDWAYQVDVRYDGVAIEYVLEITGIDETHNPGNVRLVNENSTNQMIGPGTDNACVQFPDEMDTGVLFLSPVDIINPDILIQNWVMDENQSGLERKAASYSTSQDYYFGWEDIEAELVVDSETGAILSYSFSAIGNDPLYGFGGGEIRGEFKVMELGPQNIQPVSGCKIPIPIPEDAHNIIILPGLYSFNTALGPVKIDQFYDRELLTTGWGREISASE